VSAPDFAVIGGGIVGCSLAAFLAEAGARVVVYEREAIAAGASGRNSGVVQHPLDPALVSLYEESVEHYSTLGRGFELPADPVGVLLVTDDPDNLEPEPSEFPELRPTLLEGAELRAAERGRRRVPHRRPRLPRPRRHARHGRHRRRHPPPGRRRGPRRRPLDLNHP
jgi:glycine/D-amino acid oxidase-like deaminating enzyme